MGFLFIMKKHNLVSVIVPIYQVEKYIHRCVKSILNQTYRNIEVILVDDGSPDGCPEICDEYEKLDSRVIVIHQKNQGLSAARNAGLDIANGKYIFFVDSDDYIDNNVIKKMVESAEQNNADLVICNYICVDNQGNECDDTHLKKLENAFITLEDILAQSAEAGGEVFIVAWNKLYKKELWKCYRYPVGRIHEDEFAFHHIMLRCKTIVSTDYEGYYYVQREGSIMSARSLKSQLDAMDAYIDRIDCLASDMKDFSQNLISQCYLTCSDLYQISKDKLLLRGYLQRIKSIHNEVFEGKVPVKYHIIYNGLWYMPNVFSMLLRKYKELWNMINYMESFKKLGKII